MSNKSRGWPPISIVAVTGVAVDLVSILVAFLKYPGPYSPLTNYISDLSNPLANPSGAIFTRLGGALSGVALIVFSLMLGIWNTGRKRTRVLLTIAQGLGVFSGVCAIAIAIFPLGTSTELHLLWSMVFFISVGFMVLISAVALMQNPAFKKGFAYFGFLTFAIGFVFGMLGKITLLEWIYTGMFLAYYLMIAYNSIALVRASRETATPVQSRA